MAFQAAQGLPQGPSENHCPSSILYCLPCTSRELVIPISRAGNRTSGRSETFPHGRQPPHPQRASTPISTTARSTDRGTTYRTRPQRQRGGGAHGPQGRAGRRRTRAPGKALQRGSTATEAKRNQTPAAESVRQQSLDLEVRTREGCTGPLSSPPRAPLGETPHQGKQWRPTALCWPCGHPVDAPWPSEPLPSRGGTHSPGISHVMCECSCPRAPGRSG